MFTKHFLRFHHKILHILQLRVAFYRHRGAVTRRYSYFTRYRAWDRARVQIYSISHAHGANRHSLPFVPPRVVLNAPHTFTRPLHIYRALPRTITEASQSRTFLQCKVHPYNDNSIQCTNRGNKIMKYVRAKDIRRARHRLSHSALRE